MYIKFRKGDVYTKFSVLDASYKEIAHVAGIIREATSARPDGYMFMPSYKNGHWDGYINLTKGDRFPTGLVPRAADALNDKGIYDIEVIEQEFPEIASERLSPDMLNGITLRDYQLKAARLLMSYGRGVAKMATNSGKTEVIAAMSGMIQGGVLVITTKQDLLYQTARRLKNRFGEDTARIGDGLRERERITVAMLQTLSQNPSIVESLNGCHAVMYDECHHLPSETSQEVMFSLDVPYRFGFSGTPLRHDKLSDLILIGATGEILVEVTNEDLIDWGYSAEPVIDMYMICRTHRQEDWHDAYDRCIVCGDHRNAVICDEVLDRNANSTLILVERIEHGEILENLIPGSTFVNGSSPSEERFSVLQALGSGDGSIVIATQIFDEGVDVPEVNLLVLAGGGKGHIKLLQRLGRGMRKKRGENVLNVIDFIDDTSSYLLKHSYKRAKIYENEGFDVRIKNASPQSSIQ